MSCWAAVFGSHSQLRALSEVYASDDASEKFVRTCAVRCCSANTPQLPPGMDMPDISKLKFPKQ